MFKRTVGGYTQKHLYLILLELMMPNLKGVINWLFTFFYIVIRGQLMQRILTPRRHL